MVRRLQKAPLEYRLKVHEVCVTVRTSIILLCVQCV